MANIKTKWGGKDWFELTNDDQFILNHDLLSIKDWGTEGPWIEKIANGKNRLFNEWVPKLRADGIAIPADDSALIALISAHPNYKNRVDKEKETKDVAEICKDSGKLAKNQCPLNRTKTKTFKKGTAPTDDCDIH